MRSKHIWLLIGLAIIAANFDLLARVSPSPPEPSPLLCAQPRNVAAKYRLAVDRGELRLFGKPVHRSMIKPIRVECVYQLDNSKSTTRIYSELTPPQPIPGADKGEISAVSAVLNDQHHIVAAEAHVRAKGEGSIGRQ